MHSDVSNLLLLGMSLVLCFWGVKLLASLYELLQINVGLRDNTCVLYEDGTLQTLALRQLLQKKLLRDEAASPSIPLVQMKAGAMLLRDSVTATAVAATTANPPSGPAPPRGAGVELQFKTKGSVPYTVQFRPHTSDTAVYNYLVLQSTLPPRGHVGGSPSERRRHPHEVEMTQLFAACERTEHAGGVVHTHKLPLTLPPGASETTVCVVLSTEGGAELLYVIHVKMTPPTPSPGTAAITLPADAHSANPSSPPHGPSATRGAGNTTAALKGAYYLLQDEDRGGAWCLYDVYGEEGVDEVEGEAERNSECMVCFNDYRTIVTTPCRHFSMCGDCLRRVDACPICRSHITCFVELLPSKTRSIVE